jgi:hypothetical protein
MANAEHARILQDGVDAWNSWRRQHQNILPDLSQLNLADAGISALLVFI